MVKNPPDGMPRVTPYLYYKDLETALDFLEKSFGFEKSFAINSPDGSLMHAEMTFHDGVFMMGPCNDEMGSKSPADLPGVHQSLYIYVDNVDAHFSHAKEAGAGKLTEPVDMFWGDRMYTAHDPEGHVWSFAQHVKDVAPEDMKPDC